MSSPKFLKGKGLAWPSYRRLFNITVFRYLITWFAIVPVLAGFLSDLVPIVLVQKAETFSVEIPIELPALPFTWQLLWLSSFFFVLALALYAVFLPGFIRNYPTYDDYLDEGHDPRWIVWEAYFLIKKEIGLDKFVKRMKDKKFFSEVKVEAEFEAGEPKVREKQTVYQLEFEDAKYEFAFPLLDSDGKIDPDATKFALNGIWWEVSARYASSRWFIRLLILILLGLSAVCFLYVFGENVLEGLKYVSRHFTVPTPAG